MSTEELVARHLAPAPWSIKDTPEDNEHWAWKRKNSLRRAEKVVKLVARSISDNARREAP